MKYRLSLICLSCQKEWYGQDFTAAPPLVDLDEWSKGLSDILPCDCYPPGIGLKLDNLELDQAVPIITKAQLDGVYRERNMCVSLIYHMAKQLGYHYGIYYDEQGEPGWQTLAMIDLPTGQVSWHLASDQDAWFAEDKIELKSYPGEWDGHDMDEKYNRVLKYGPQMELLDQVRDEAQQKATALWQQMRREDPDLFLLSGPHAEPARSPMGQSINFTHTLGNGEAYASGYVPDEPRLTHDGKPLAPGETEVAEFTPEGLKYQIGRAVMDTEKE